MKNKYIRISGIIAGSLLILLLIANFGLNFWLKKNLPNYIKNNSDYLISYKFLDVNLTSGNIFATGVSVMSKNPQNQNVIGLQGTVDSLTVGRLGIYDALFYKRINSSNLILKNPNLNIILAKPVNEKTGKKKNPVAFKNIQISDGNIKIFRHTKQKLFSVNNLNLEVQNLQMTEKSVGQKMPVVFDKYDIQGENFFYRPDNVYAFKAENITTKNGQMNIRNFKMIPLLSYANFRRFFPKKDNLYNFSASEMNFKDLLLKKNKISFADVHFENPNLKLFTSGEKSKQEKAFTYNLEMENVSFDNSQISVFNGDGTPKFTVGKINFRINQLVMNDETKNGNIPFAYQKYKVDGQNIQYFSATEAISVAGFAFNPKALSLVNVNAKPTAVLPDKVSLDFSVHQINLKINEWKFVDKKLKLDIENLFVNNLNGKIVAPDSKKRKANFSGVEFPLKVNNIVIQNSTLNFQKNGKTIALNALNSKVKNLEMNAETVKNDIPFKTENYSVTAKDFSYHLSQFYDLNAGLIKVNKGNMQLNNFYLKPLVSRSQFIRMIPAEKDLYDVKVSQISINGNWNFGTNKFLDLSSANFNGVNAVIFRSKIPKDDLSEKPLYSKLLRSINFPMFISDLNIKNSVLVYEEDKPDNNGPGKLTFNSFNMNVKNLNSAKLAGKPTNIPITVNCLFMNASPMKIKWNFDTAKSNDAFDISGNISDLPAERINPFIRPYLNIVATGLIQDLIFNFHGNNVGLNGMLNMNHKDLKISVLNKESKEKNRFLSAIANLIIKTNSGNYPKSVTVDNIKRDPSKSFFNLLWKGIQEGLQKTLIGKNVEKKDKNIQKPVESSETPGASIGKAATVKAEVKTRKSGIFQKIFKKKEKPSE